MKKFLAISVILVNTVYAENLQNTLVTLFKFCADEPNREVYACINKSEEVKKTLYKKKIDVDFVDTVGTTCFSVCSVPTSLDKIIKRR